MSMILASASETRLKLLLAAGVPCAAEPARVDEEPLKRALAAEGAGPDRAALALAELKAVRVSRRHPGALVLGADQMLDCEGAWFAKPADMAAAKAQLLALRGRTHRLTSAVVAAQDGARLWHHVEAARLAMRPFSDSFLERYLAEAGTTVLASVGAYQIEGLGAQLFVRVEGDHSTILGLPLLPVLDFLRGRGALAT